MLVHTILDVTNEAGTGGAYTGATLKTRMYRDETGIAQCTGYSGSGTVIIEGRLAPDAPWESVMGDADPSGGFTSDDVKLSILIMPEMRASASGISAFDTLTAKIHLME
ncbi:MAG: hypothetical protein QF404_08650 [Planctomycetota bacterium]|jgi:hypothetical protein|nr:hypothetical protein [Planctomycetota bacterium]